MPPRATATAISVALLLENRPEMFVHYLALNALGRGIVPVNPDYRHDELAFQMDHSEADLAIAVPERDGRAGGSGARARPAAARGRRRRAGRTALPQGEPAAARGRAPRSTRSARSSTPPAPPGGPRAACSTISTCLNAGAWYRDLGGRLAIAHGRERILNPLPLFHMNCLGGDGHLRHPHRQLPRPAGALQPAPLVGGRGRDRAPLPSTIWA